jgi:hypothetical protein
MPVLEESRMRKSLLPTAFALFLAAAMPAAAQAVYHIEKDPPRSYYNWYKIADKGHSHIEPVTGFYNGMLEEDLDLHAFGWKDGYYTADGQPTYMVQMSIHRQPRPFTRIPVVNVTDNVYLARYNRNAEWRVPMTGATYYIFPESGNPAADQPLAVVNSRSLTDDFRTRAGKLPWRRFLVKAVVDHYGEEDGRRIEFQRTYVFRTPTIDLVDGRHEPYELYNWFW